MIIIPKYKNIWNFKLALTHGPYVGESDKVIYDIKTCFFTIGVLKCRKKLFLYLTFICLKLKTRELLEDLKTSPERYDQHISGVIFKSFRSALDFLLWANEFWYKKHFFSHGYLGTSIFHRKIFQKFWNGETILKTVLKNSIIAAKFSKAFKYFILRVVFSIKCTEKPFLDLTFIGL